MGTVEVIDLCSDDSIISATVTSGAPSKARTPLNDSMTRSNLQNVANFDSDSDLDGLLLPTAKRRRLQVVNEAVTTSSEKTRGSRSPENRQGAVARSLSLLESDEPISLTDLTSFSNCNNTKRPSIVEGAMEGAFGLSQNTVALLAEMKTKNPKRKPVTSEIGFEDVEHHDAFVVETGLSTTITSKQIVRKQMQDKRNAAKEAAKAASAEAKRFERERKAMEKEIASQHAEANKARWDKKISTSEMIVDVPSSMADGHMARELKRLLAELNVEHTTYEGGEMNLVKWRRRSKTTFNREKHHWEMRPEIILDEPHVLYILSAKDFVTKVQSQEGLSGIIQCLNQLKASLPGHQILCIIEGLESFLKKKRTLKNRSYVASVRQEETAAMCKAASTDQIDEDRIEEALAELPIALDCFIFQTVNALETAEWIGDFTQHISTVPYKHERNNIDSQFCMETGQVKAGDDAQDIFVRALQQVVRVTAPVAYGIAAHYPDMASLVNAFERDGDLAVADVQKSLNRDGAVSNARVGPQISRRLARVFLNQDPECIDI